MRYGTLYACTGERPRVSETARTMVIEVAPWIGRRVRDLAPWAAHRAISRARGALRFIVV